MAENYNYFTNNFNNLCRLCLSEERLVNIYSEVEGRNVFYIRTFIKDSFKWLGLTIDKEDGLPNNICEKCERNLNIIFNFQKVCQASHEKLVNIKNNFRIPPSPEIQDAGFEEVPEIDTTNYKIEYEEVYEVEKQTKEVSDDQDKFILEDIIGETDSPYEEDVEELKEEAEKVGVRRKKQCPICGQMISHLRAHLRVHNDERNYQCSRCQKAFRNKTHLNSHTNRVHFKIRSYECLDCKKSFLDSNNLRAHKLIHIGNRKHKCGFCDKGFLLPGTLNAHLLTHSKEKNFHCHFCPKSFISKTALTNHLRVHTDERKYICEYCNKGFKTSTHMKQHVKTHTGEKSLPCKFCGTLFKTYKARGVHIRSKHMQENYVELGVDSENFLQVVDEQFISENVEIVYVDDLGTIKEEL